MTLTFREQIENKNIEEIEDFLKEKGVGFKRNNFKDYIKLSITNESASKITMGIKKERGKTVVYGIKNTNSVLIISNGKTQILF